MDLFDQLLLSRLRTYGHQTWQGGRGWARNPAWGIRFHGNGFVLIRNGIFSQSSPVCLIVLDFGMWSLLGHRGLPAENEQNPPAGSRDSTWQPTWQPCWGPGGLNAKRHLDLYCSMMSLLHGDQLLGQMTSRVARDIIVTSYGSASDPWACQISNFSNRTIISWDTAYFVKWSQFLSVDVHILL